MTYLKRACAILTLLGVQKDREPAVESKVSILSGRYRHGPVTVG